MWCVLRVRLVQGGCAGSFIHPLHTFHTPYTTHTRSHTPVFSSDVGYVKDRVRRRGRFEREGFRSITTAVSPLRFWEKDPKGEYAKEIKKNRKDLIREGLKQLRQEIQLWQHEMKENFDVDPICVRDGDMDKAWILNSKESLDGWIVTSDSDHGEGTSKASLTLSPGGHGLFSGEICYDPPKDGKIKRSGYCNMKTIRPRRSFKREVCHNWSSYNTLELRIRGDGRPYMVTISCAGYYDITWNDVYSYPLYTRGGPHWQLTRIPFSKFYLSSKGRIQDKQSPMPLNQISTLGITAGDRSNAPFRLEIDYIGLYRDPTHKEVFAYESYIMPHPFYASP